MQEEKERKFSVDIFDRICITCSSEYKGRVNSKYCPECARKKKLEQDKIAGRKYRAKLKAKEQHAE